MNKLEESIGYHLTSAIYLKFFRKEPIHIVGVNLKGHLWIATHEGYDTLTWEPYDETGESVTGQYEIAVRIHTKSDDDMYTLPGYVAVGGYLSGCGTGGH